MERESLKSVVQINFEVWSEIEWCKHLLIKNEAIIGHSLKGELPIPFKLLLMGTVPFHSQLQCGKKVDSASSMKAVPKLLGAS